MWDDDGVDETRSGLMCDRALFTIYCSGAWGWVGGPKFVFFLYP
jgi:hypothetical protein